MCVTNVLDKQGMTARVCGVEEDVALKPLPVLYILKYTNVFTSVGSYLLQKKINFLDMR